MYHESSFNTSELWHFNVVLNIIYLRYTVNITLTQSLHEMYLWERGKTSFLIIQVHR